jgi:D-3-phosphoglycerate dehydrogenase / 2-oxoglutarate reductase
MTRPRVAITIRSFDQSGGAMKKLIDEFEIVYINSTGLRLSEYDLISAIKNAEYVIAGTELFSKSVLETSPRLKVISRVGVGIDNIDITTAEKHNVCILNTPEAPGLAVAEHTLALLLTLLKNIPKYNNQMRSGNYPVEPGLMLSGKTVGIIGLGRIGYRVATMLAALGCTINYYDPYVRNNPPSGWVSASSIQDLVRSVEVVSLHSSPQKECSAILNSEVFSVCRKGIIVINTARGSLIDERALADALEAGIVSAAGLDVFLTEPYSGELLKYPQVIVTPHVASNTIESRQQMEMEAVEHIIDAKRRIIQ